MTEHRGVHEIASVEMCDNERVVGFSKKSEIALDKLRYAPFDQAQYESQIAGGLARLFIWILIIALVTHYLILLVLFVISLFIEKNDQIEVYITELQATYNVWFPAIVGIVSSVTTYYFTRERR